MTQGEQAGIGLCLRKGYKIWIFYKCLRNEGEITPKWRHPNHSLKWNENLIDFTIDLIGKNQTLTLEEIISYI